MKTLLTVLLITGGVVAQAQDQINNNTATANPVQIANPRASSNQTQRQSVQNTNRNDFRANVQNRNNVRNDVRNTNQNRNVNNNVNAGNASAAIVDNSVYEAPFDMTGYVAWKEYQDRRTRRTKKGAPLSPLDNQAAQPAPAKPAPSTSQARYDAFLRSKGINPNTIGGATKLADGSMYVPTVEETYAARNANTAAQLARVRNPEGDQDDTEVASR